MSGPYQPLWREMEEKYVEAEDVWWMCERPEEVLADIEQMVRALEDHYHNALERSERD